MKQSKNGRKNPTGTRSPWRVLKRFPPVLVRLLAREPVARKHVRALSDQEVAIRAEMPLKRIAEISSMTSWDTVPIGEAERFCRACRFDPFNCYDRNRAAAYNRTNARYTYLRISPYWNKTFKPLIKVLADAQVS